MARQARAARVVSRLTTFSRPRRPRRRRGLRHHDGLLVARRAAVRGGLDGACRAFFFWPLARSVLRAPDGRSSVAGGEGGPGNGKRRGRCGAPQRGTGAETERVDVTQSWSRVLSHARAVHSVGRGRPGRCRRSDAGPDLLGVAAPRLPRDAGHSSSSPAGAPPRARHVPCAQVCSPSASRSSLSSAGQAAFRSSRPTSPSASSSLSAPTPSGAAPSTPTPAPTHAVGRAAARLPSLPWTALLSAGAATSVALSGPCHTHVIAFDRRPCGRDGVLADVPRTLQCRIPTSFCGVYSLKPAAGRVSMAGAEG